MGAPLVATGYNVVLVRPDDGSSDAGDNVKIGYLKDFTPSDGRSNIDVTAVGDGTAVMAVGLRTISFSGTGNYSIDDAGQVILKAGYDARTGVILTVIYNNAGASTHKGFEYSCNVDTFVPKFASTGEVTFDLKLSLSSSTLTAV